MRSAPYDPNRRLPKKVRPKKQHKRRFLREVPLTALFSYFYLSIPLLALSVLGIIYADTVFDERRRQIAAIVVFSLLSYLFLKRLALGCILMYKAHAPMHIRGQCRFEPCCSTYAFIAVKRYGLILGILLAFLRIQRCQPPYGGEDPPSLRHLGRLFHKS